MKYGLSLLLIVSQLGFVNPPEVAPEAITKIHYHYAGPTIRYQKFGERIWTKTKIAIKDNEGEKVLAEKEIPSTPAKWKEATTSVSNLIKNSGSMKKPDPDCMGCSISELIIYTAKDTVYLTDKGDAAYEKSFQAITTLMMTDK